MSDGIEPSARADLEDLPKSDGGSPDAAETVVIPRTVRKPRSRLTSVLKALAVAMLGFVAGIQAQKLASPGSGGSPSAGPAAPGASPGAARHPVDPSRGFGAAGRVKFIDGSTIYVTDPTGTTIEVRTSRASRFTKPARGTLSDVRPGDQITVHGSRGSDGAVRASSVVVSRKPSRR
jgi:hypothetical protein